MPHSTGKPNTGPTAAVGPKQRLADFICPCFFSCLLKLLTGLQVHPKNRLAWTWSIAETNQAMVAGDKTGAQRQESTRSTNAQFTQYCSCCPAGPRPPP
jgi:hypothetical protein